jgi:predicted lipoprotein with Yx(FWY)xxD motif
VTKTFPAIAVLALVSLLAIAGCGGSDSSGSNSGGAYGGGGEKTETTKPASSESGDTAAVVTASTAGDLGKVIVDSKGMTLYDFHKDKGGKSACYGACAKGWPPLLSEGEPQAGEGAMASKLGTVERTDGTMQVTYAGHPLYTFVEDKKPGEANGNDVSAFGAQWYALQPSGQEAEG